ncbi:MAG TPA: helix-turn-helix domain-containing protein [Solirubrobacterales bacterium]
MGRAASTPARRAEQARAKLAERLRARRGEIEESLLTRVYAIADPTEAADPDYAEGLRAAVAGALDYGLAGIEAGEEHPPAFPDLLLSQARFAARNGISLDTVLRRYFAGYTLLGDVLIEETQDDELLRGEELKRLLRSQAALFDRLLAAVGEEHVKEAESRPESPERRRAERVERLLAGELIDVAELGYELDAHHLGAIAAGPGAAEAVRSLARALDRRLLLIQRLEGMVWVWLGGRRPLEHEELGRALERGWSPEVTLALGECGRGLGGWRFTHHQARAALPIALRQGKTTTRYSEVALLASAHCDELLSASLRELYLEPLSGTGDDGATMRETLRAYFNASRNLSSAASALGVSRRTVANRLRTIEERLGKSLSAETAEIEVALRLQELEESRWAWRNSGKLLPPLVR